MKVSCIIPVYNEAERVGNVLRAVVGHPLVDEVIVVNDGSTDGSQAVLEQQQGIQLISLERNKGKSYALTIGIKQSQNDIVMLLDSDLSGLNEQNINDLIQPVLDGRVDMSISLRRNALLIYKMLGLDFFSGERVFSKRIIEDLEQFQNLASFAFETILNRIIIAKSFRVKVVPWRGVAHARKYEKLGWWRGLQGEFRMVAQILSTGKLPNLLKEIRQLRSLRIR